jgi:Transposase DDE domain
MHNIHTNFRKFYGICKELFKKDMGNKKYVQFYPVPPKMNDLEIISLACCMEALGIDSENLLWSKIKKDYASNFPNLIDRSRFNRRRKRLAPFILQLQDYVSTELENQSQTMIVDSVPVPVVKMAREKSFKAFKKSFETAPAKGWSAVNKNWFIGYKLHVIIYDNGVVQQSGITKANVHDINFLKEAEDLPPKKTMLGDRAYVSKTLQMELFEQYKVSLKVPFKINQIGYKKHPKKYKSKRQMVETFFSQMCDQFHLKRNYAKSYEGLAVRLASKLSSMSLLHWINHLNGKKLAHIKHALSF